jgi:hypothetical protein
MKKILTLALAALLLSAPVILAQEPEPPKAPPAAQEKGLQRGGKNFRADFKMTPEDEQKIIASFSEETKKALEVLKSSDMRAYNRALRRAEYRKFAMLDMSLMDDGQKRFQQKAESRKQMMELEIQSEALGVQYEKAEAAQKAKLKSDLQNKLSQLFDMKEAQQKEEVQNLEKRLAELKEKLDVRQKNKSQIIERKMQDYLDEEDYLEW